MERKHYNILELMEKGDSQPFYVNAYEAKPILKIYKEDPSKLTLENIRNAVAYVAEEVYNYTQLELVSDSIEYGFDIDHFAEWCKDKRFISDEKLEDYHYAKSKLIEVGLSERILLSSFLSYYDENINRIGFIINDESLDNYETACMVIAFYIYDNEEVLKKTFDLLIRDFLSINENSLVNFEI